MRRCPTKQKTTSMAYDAACNARSYQRSEEKLPLSSAYFLASLWSCN